MPTFLQSQAAFGPPAEAPFIEQPVELEAQAEAYRKKADLSYTQGLGLPSTPYVSRTVTDPNTPTLDEKYYKLAQSNYQEQVSEIMKDVEASGEKLTPELKSRLIQFKQKKNALSQEGGLYDILGQRKERYSTALELLEKSEANDERKKQFREMLDDSFTKSGLGTDFYVPPIIESTKYTDQILKIANDISTLDLNTIEGKKAFNAYITTIPGLPSEKFLLKETQLTDIKTPERIAAVIQAYINANPDIKTDIKADTDYNAWREVNDLKSVSNPDSEYYDPNYQYDKEKGLFYDQNTNTVISKDEIRQQHFQQKINTLAGLGAEAEKTWKYKESLQIGTDAAREARLQKKIEDEQLVFGRPLLVAGKYSEFKSPDDIQNYISTNTNNNTAITEQAENYIKYNKFNKNTTDIMTTLLRKTAEGKPVKEEEFNNAIGLDGKDHSEYFKVQYRIIKENLDKSKAALEYDTKIKKEAGLDTNWKPSKEAIQAGNAIYKQQTTSITDPITGKLIGDIKNVTLTLKQAEQAKKDIMSQKDPNYKKYLESLENNAKERTYDISPTTFPSKTVSTQLAGIIHTDLTEQGGLSAKDTKGNPITEYPANIKIDPNEVYWAMQDGELKLVVRPTELNEEGKPIGQLDYHIIDAPEGTLYYLIKNNIIETADAIIDKYIDQMEKSPNKVKSINYNGEEIILSESAPSTKQKTAEKTYSITYQNKVFPYTTKQTLKQALKSIQ